MSSRDSGTAPDENFLQNEAFWTLERDAARLARGLDCSRDWPQIIEAARQLVVCATNWSLAERLDAAHFHQSDSRAALLHGAARSLDSAAQFAPSQGGKSAREAGLWAAGAYALAGNFPCSTVVLKRTLPRLNAPFPSRGVAYQPELVALVRAFSPVLATRAEVLCEGKYDETEALWASVEAEFGDLAKIARASFDAAKFLSTSRWLQTHGGALKNGAWREILAARVPILLAPQALALENGLLQRQNALVALPPGTGKTWLGELFLVEALARLTTAPQDAAEWNATKSASDGEASQIEVPNPVSAEKPADFIAKTLKKNVQKPNFDAGNARTETESLTSADGKPQNGDGELAPVAVFLVPYVALGRGVVAAFGAHLPGEIALHSWMGNALEDELDGRAAIIVATPERFDAAWRSDTRLRGRVVAVAVDEAHTLGEGARGVRLEGLMARLLSAPTRPHLLLLSAVVDEFKNLSRWIAMPDSTLELESDENAQISAKKAAKKVLKGRKAAKTSNLKEKNAENSLPNASSGDFDDENAPKKRFCASKRDKFVEISAENHRKLEDLDGLATVCASRWTPTARRLAFWRGGALDWWADCAGRGLVSLGRAPLQAPHARIEAGDDWVKSRRAEPLVWENVAFLAHELWENRGGATLCLCATRRATRQLARFLAQKFEELPENDGARGEAIVAIETRHRTLLPLARLLKHGVAWHNASLPPQLRALIERAVQNGEIRALAATRTLAEGVDLPFAQTILADWLAWDEGAQKPLSPALFRNIAGRCGRAGAFCEGDTFVFDNPLGPSQFTAPDVRASLQNELYLGGELAQPSSALDFAGEDLAIQTAFESQVLAVLAEGVAPRFYAATCEPAKFGELWAVTLEKLRAQNWVEGETLSPRGLALARADVSPATGLKLLGALESLPRGDWKNPAQWPRLNAYLWRAVGGSSESGGEIERFFAPRSRFLARPADLENVGARWLSGESAEAIFAALGAEKSAKFPSAEALRAWMDGEDENGAKLDGENAEWTQDFDRWLDFLRAGMENWAPRLWRAVGALAPLLTGRDDLKTLDWNNAAACFGAGVPTLWAANILRNGAPGGREVAAILAREWPFEPKPGDALALSPLGNSPQAIVVANRAMRRALHAVGGPNCASGANLKELRDWLWARAGLGK